MGRSVNGADGRRGPGSSARAAGVVGVLGVGVVSICIVWLAMPSASTRDHVTDVRLEAPVGRAATTTLLPPVADALPAAVTDAPTAPSTSHASSRNQTYLAAPPSGAAPTGAPPPAVTVLAAAQPGPTATEYTPPTVVLSTLGDVPTTTHQSTTTAKPTTTHRRSRRRPPPRRPRRPRRRRRPRRPRTTLATDHDARPPPSHDHRADHDGADHDRADDVGDRHLPDHGDRHRGTPDSGRPAVSGDHAMSAKDWLTNPGTMLGLSFVAFLSMTGAVLADTGGGTTQVVDRSAGVHRGARRPPPRKSRRPR